MEKLKTYLFSFFNQSQIMTSKKSRIFENEHIGDKDAIEIPGIGEIYFLRLKNLGFEKAENVLGQFLLLQKDSELFEIWLQDEIKMQPMFTKICSTSLNNWCENFL